MKFLTLTTVALLTASSAYAQPQDIIGGAGGDTQTMTHCGYLKTQNVIYTNSPVTTRIVQTKLSRLGFYRAAIDGVNGRGTRDAVRRYQQQYSLSADGVVGPKTVQSLAFQTNPNPHVRRCWREANSNFRAI